MKKLILLALAGLAVLSAQAETLTLEFTPKGWFQDTEKVTIHLMGEKTITESTTAVYTTASQASDGKTEHTLQKINLGTVINITRTDGQTQVEYTKTSLIGTVKDKVNTKIDKFDVSFEGKSATLKNVGKYKKIKLSVTD